jgi:hypothetical protein
MDCLGPIGGVSCATLPLLGAIGLGGGALAAFSFLEPMKVGLLALAVASAVVSLAWPQR